MAADRNSSDRAPISQPGSIDSLSRISVRSVEKKVPAREAALVFLFIEWVGDSLSHTCLGNNSHWDSRLGTGTKANV